MHRQAAQQLGSRFGGWGGERGSVEAGIFAAVGSDADHANLRQSGGGGSTDGGFQMAERQSCGPE